MTIDRYVYPGELGGPQPPITPTFDLFGGIGGLLSRLGRMTPNNISGQQILPTPGPAPQFGQDPLYKTPLGPEPLPPYGGNPPIPSHLPYPSQTPGLVTDQPGGMSAGMGQAPAGSMTEGMSPPIPGGMPQQQEPIPPMVQDMIDYQQQTDRMINAQREADRTSMWMGIADSMLRGAGSGDYTGGLGGAFQAYGQRQQQKPTYDAMRSARTDQYVDRLHKMAQVGKLREGERASPSEQKFGMQISQIESAIDAGDHEEAQRMLDTMTGFGPDSPKHDSANRATIYPDGTVQIWGGERVAIDSPEFRDHINWVASSEQAAKGVGKSMAQNAEYQKWVELVGEEYASMIAPPGASPEQVADRVFEILSRGNPARKEALETMDPRLRDAFFQQAEVQEEIRKALAAQ